MINRGVIVGQVGGTGLKQNLYAYYALENYNDSHINAKHLSAIGSPPPSQVAGKIGNAYQFSGAPHLLATAFLSASLAGRDFSLTMQFKLPASPPAGNSLLSLDQFTSGPYLWVHDVNGYLKAYYAGGYYYSVIAERQVWHHFAYTYKAATNTHKIYLDNGAPAVTTNGLIHPAPTNLRLGSGFYPNGYGAVDEVGVWLDRELSAEDVALLYNGGVGLTYLGF